MPHDSAACARWRSSHSPRLAHAHFAYFWQYRALYVACECGFNRRNGGIQNMLQSENHRRVGVHAMFSFKSYKRKCLIRLMTVLGLGGMVGFCIASCQSPKANPDQQTEQKSSVPGNSEQPEQQTETQTDNPSPQNTETQDVQEAI